MWKTFLNKAVKDLRFVLKPSVDQHGAWRFVETRLPELRLLNQNTMFSVAEITNAYETDSAIHINYDGPEMKEEVILTEGLSFEEIEKVIKRSVERGMQMERQLPLSNYDRDLPVDIVEAGKYDKHYDDGF